MAVNLIDSQDITITQTDNDIQLNVQKDSSTSTSSTKPVENQAITNYVDTKGIYASGSNANGEYIKYDDGTMICYIEKNVSNFNFTQDSSYYFYNLENISFPEQFYAKPVVNVSLENTSEFRRLNVGGTYAITNTGIGSITIWNYWGSTGDAVNLHIIAIGKWK